MFDRQILSLPGAPRALAVCLAASLLLSACIIGQAFSLSHAIVGVWSGDPFAAQAPALAAFAACFVLRSVLRAWEDARMESYAHGCVSRLRKRFAGRLYDAGGSLVDGFGSAAVVTSLVEGCTKAETYLRRTLPKVVAMAVVPLAVCAAVFSQDAVSGVIVAVCYPFIVAFMRLVGYTAKDESAKRHEGFVEMSAHFMDSLRGMGTLRAFGMADGYAKTVHAASERYRRMVMRTLRIAQLSGAVLDVFATCGLAAVAIMLGFRMVEGTVAFLPALVVLMLVPEFFIPIKAYASDYHASLDGKSALAKMLSMGAHPRRAVSLACGPVRIEEGATVAVVGPSGSGKSSLLEAIAGTADVAEGDLVVCGVTGAGFLAPEWRARVAYIPQHPYVFAGTLRDNVALYAPQASDAEVAAALAKVGLGELAAALPGGLGCALGTGGRALSGGEAHRVALARAIVGGRDVWLLDEPGSSLDAQSARELREAVRPLMEGRTVVVATHDAAWAREAGEVVDVGAREEVRHGRA